LPKTCDAAGCERRCGHFPPIYARLIEAGIRSGNLVGVLHSFGRHLATVARLRQELWRACAYPLVVLLAFGMLMIFLSYWVLPQYFRLLDGLFATSGGGMSFLTTRSISPGRQAAPNLPLLAVAIFWLGRAMPFLLGAVAVATVVVVGAWAILRSLGRERGWVDTVVLRLPLLGSAIRHSYVARYVDALAIAVRSGLDLPRALDLASHVVALPSFERDGRSLIAALEQGRPLDQAPRPRRLPASLPPAIALASSAGNLPDVLSALARQYEQQADRRTRLIPATVVPLLILLIGLTAGAIVYSLWVPMVRLLQNLTGVF
jgi:type II secretory pathway component PulF